MQKNENDMLVNCVKLKILFLKFYMLNEND